MLTFDRPAVGGLDYLWMEKLSTLHTIVESVQVHSIPTIAFNTQHSPPTHVPADSSSKMAPSIAETNKISLDECSLPPYEELKQTDCYDILSLDLPPPTATSKEVADFLVRLLVSTDIPINRARDIASKWTSGSGEELREYQPVLYLEVFGKEDGWALYLAVYQAIHKEKSRDFWYRHNIREYHSPAHGGKSQDPS
jgi:hypothetical protein